MDPLSGRVAAWLIRRASFTLVFAGGALFVAGIPALSAISGGARDVLVIVLQVGAAWVALGLAAGAVSYRPASPTGAWTVVVAAALVVGAAWLLFTVQPFLSEWRVVASLLQSSGLLRSANANMSGVVLLPIAAALAPPFIELAALAALVVCAVLMLVLALTRSPRFTTLYLASALVITALVAGSVRGADAASMTTGLLQPVIEQSKPRPEEYAVIRGTLDRYSAAVAPTATTLVWSCMAYVMWVPPVLLLSLRRG